GGRLLKQDEFEFTLSSTDDADNATQTVKNNADGTVVFANLKYDQEDIGKTYNYKVVEKVPTPQEGGMTYSANILTFKVTVTDAGGGVLTATKSDITGETEFVNVYKAKGEFDVNAGIGVTKRLDAGGRLLKQDEFEFTLSSTDDADNATQTVKNNADGTVVFANLKYDQEDIGKTYSYKVVEKVPTPQEGGMTYSANILTFKVKVTDAGGGILIATKSDVTGDTEFVNEYKAKGEFDVNAGIGVTKRLDAGGRLLKAGEFSFTLNSTDDPDNNQTVTNAADGTVIFANLKYDQADIGKTYNYKVVEKVPTPPEGGMTYSANVLTFKVKVTDAGGGVLTATKSDVTGDTEFVNEYKAKGEYDIKALLNPRKELSGRPLENQEFNFSLWLDNQQIQSVKNNADGTIPFDKLTYTEADIGKTFIYTISEVVPEVPAAGITYDTMVLTFKITVTDAGNGQLAIKAEKPKDLTFNNIYVDPKKPNLQHPWGGVYFNLGDCFE
ncbi:MAG: FctA domain-containing protein, partial [Bacillota bacterium]|nr:FctA domain-containing protein [Bacillota bacterium]